MKNNRINTLVKIFEKYKFTDSLPGDAKKRMLSAKKRTFIKILRSQNRSSVFLLLTAAVFFLAKRLGLTLSLYKSAIVTVAVLTGLAASVTTGSVYIYHRYTQGNTGKKQQGPLINNAAIEHSGADRKGAAGRISQTTPGPVAYRLHIVPFEYDAVDKDLALEITQSVCDELNRLKGDHCSRIIDRAKKGTGPQKLLLGSIVKLDNTMLITVRVMDTQSSKIVQYITEEARSPGLVDAACRKIASRIAEGL